MSESKKSWDEEKGLRYSSTDQERCAGIERMNSSDAKRYILMTAKRNQRESCSVAYVAGQSFSLINSQKRTKIALKLRI